MSNSGAPFHELLPGVGRTTAARLHDDGIRSWADLVVVLDVVARIRDVDAPLLRQLRDEARRLALEEGVTGPDASTELPTTDPPEAQQPGPGGEPDDGVVGERAHSFVVKVTVLASGRAARTSVTDVRSGETRTGAGLSISDIARTISEAIDLEPPLTVGPPVHVFGRPGTRQPARFNVDLGSMPGGDQDELVVGWDTTSVEIGDGSDALLAYRALLTARADEAPAPARLRIVDVARGRARPGELVELTFDVSNLGAGSHRLGLSVEVQVI